MTRLDYLYPIPPRHLVLGAPLRGPWPEGAAVLYVAMGCFWGAEKLFWETPGVISTAVGYMGGTAPYPTYIEVCSGRTGHAETVQVVYDPSRISIGDLLRVFWENHDPTTPNRQGNDIGTQYRSAVFWSTPEQRDAVETSAGSFGKALQAKGFAAITTQLLAASQAGQFYYAEGEHQQYLHANPGGYCPVHATGVRCDL